MLHYDISNTILYDPKNKRMRVSERQRKLIDDSQLIYVTALWLYSRDGNYNKRGLYHEKTILKKDDVNLFMKKFDEFFNIYNLEHYQRIKQEIKTILKKLIGMKVWASL
jgi:hypothetical protein